MKLDWRGILGRADKHKRVLLPYAVSAFYVIVTTGRVAHYAGQFEPPGWEWLGWAYAVALDLAIAVCAQYTRWKTTRLAWYGYFAAIAASGAMNIAHVRPMAQEQWLAAWIYTLVPTAATAFLVFLARDAQGLVKRERKSDNKPQPIADVAQGNGHKPLVCEYCDKPIPSGTQQGRSAHLRRCPVYLAQKKEGKREIR